MVQLITLAFLLSASCSFLTLGLIQLENFSRRVCAMWKRLFGCMVGSNPKPILCSKECKWASFSLFLSSPNTRDRTNMSRSSKEATNFSKRAIFFIFLGVVKGFLFLLLAYGSIQLSKHVIGYYCSLSGIHSKV